MRGEILRKLDSNMMGLDKPHNDILIFDKVRGSATVFLEFSKKG
jgi:hypothetical protein